MTPLKLDASLVCEESLSRTGEGIPDHGKFRARVEGEFAVDIRCMERAIHEVARGLPKAFPIGEVGWRIAVKMVTRDGEDRIRARDLQRLGRGQVGEDQLRALKRLEFHLMDALGWVIPQARADAFRPVVVAEIGVELRERYRRLHAEAHQSARWARNGDMDPGVALEDAADADDARYELERFLEDESDDIGDGTRVPYLYRYEHETMAERTERLRGTYAVPYNNKRRKPNAPARTSLSLAV